MVGIRLDLQAEARGDLTLEIQVLDTGGVNPDTSLGGWIGHMQIRAARDETSALLAEAVVTVDGATGTVTAVVPASALDDDWVTGQYDLSITDGVRTEWLAWGAVRLARRVTVAA